MSNILIIYSTVYGQTLKVSKFLQEKLQDKGQNVDIKEITDSSISLDAYDKIVIGCSIRHGKHSRELYDFIAKNQTAIEAKPNSFFSINLVARKPNKNTPETNPYLQKFLQQITWKPKLLGVFAGILDYQKYGLFDRYMIRFIMTLTKGPTDMHTNIEFTNWDRVAEFVDEIIELK